MLPCCVCLCSQQVDRMVGKNRSDMFGELLQAANNTGDLRSCPVRRSFHQHHSTEKKNERKKKKRKKDLCQLHLQDTGAGCTLTFELLVKRLFCFVFLLIQLKTCFYTLQPSDTPPPLYLCNVFLFCLGDCWASLT